MQGGREVAFFFSGVRGQGSGYASGDFGGGRTGLDLSHRRTQWLHRARGWTRRSVDGPRVTLALPSTIQEQLTKTGDTELWIHGRNLPRCSSGLKAQPVATEERCTGGLLESVRSIAQHIQGAASPFAMQSNLETNGALNSCKMLTNTPLFTDIIQLQFVLACPG